jgi:release factor glutamine methyltransferase
VSTVASVLRASGLPALEARVLLCHALGVPRAWLTAHDRDELSVDAVAKAQRLFARRHSGEPVAYLTREREFYGRRFAVSPAVLIPRPETELLVEAALERLSQGASALDIGTGSGAIAITLALERTALHVAACDMSDQALAVARANAAALGARVEWLASDWLAAFHDRRFDVIVSNPPYIASADRHLSEGDLRFEPRSALEAGPTGLEAIRRIAADARGHLVDGGWLAFEHGYDQGETCVELLSLLGYCDIEDRRDLAGQPRVALARFDPSHTTR